MFTKDNKLWLLYDLAVSCLDAWELNSICCDDLHFHIHSNIRCRYTVYVSELVFTLCIQDVLDKVFAITCKVFTRSLCSAILSTKSVVKFWTCTHIILYNTYMSALYVEFLYITEPYLWCLQNVLFVTLAALKNVCNSLSTCLHHLATRDCNILLKTSNNIRRSPS